MRVKNENLLVLDGAAVSGDMSASFTLEPIWLGHMHMYSIQLVFTGAPVGTWTLESSNDPGHPERRGEAAKWDGVSNWTTVLDSSQAVSGSGDHTWQVDAAAYNWVRVKWTRTSGSGTLTSARAYMKGV